MTRRDFSNSSAQSPFYQLFVSLMVIMGIGITLSIILSLAGMMVFGSAEEQGDPLAGDFVDDDELRVVTA